jgi:metallo-beta-lactamase class B
MKKTVICTVMLLLAICQVLTAEDLNEVQLIQIGPKTWVHTSYETVGGYRTDSHGLVVDTLSGVVLVDTCWNDKQTEILLSMIRQKLGKSVVEAFVTHAHQDRIGGIRCLLAARIRVLSTPLTSQLSLQAGYPSPEPELTENPDLQKIGEMGIEVYFPGPGHTRDNVVVWVEAERVLFAGCIAKSCQSSNLGNIAEADLLAWPQSVQNLIDRYPAARVVVPGHGSWGGVEVLEHTIDLCRANRHERSN